MHRVQKPLCLIHFCVIPFFEFSPLCGNKKWASQYEDEEVGKIVEQNQLNRLQMVQFECQRVTRPLVSYTSGVYCSSSLFTFTVSMRNGK